MLNFPTDKYNNKLYEWIYTYDYEESDEIEYALIRRICTCHLSREDSERYIERIKLTEEEKGIISNIDYYKIKCRELKARIFDVLLFNAVIRGKDRLCIMEQCSDLYLSLFKEFDDFYYIVRSIEVRKIDTLYTKEFCARLSEAIRNADLYPFVINRIIGPIIRNCSTEFVKDLISIYRGRKDDKDCNWKEQYYELLLSCKDINESEYHFQMALNYEAEGDEIVANREQHTIYPNLHKIYHQAYQEIYKVKSLRPIDLQRIHDKLETANKEFVECLSMSGIRTKYDLPEEIKLKIRKTVLKDIQVIKPIEIIGLIINVPYFPGDEMSVDKIREKISKGSVVDSFLYGIERMDENGNTIGISSNESFITLEAKTYARQTLLYFLWTLICYYDTKDEKVEEAEIYQLLLWHHSKYVDDQALITWAKAIFNILNGDSILGTYALMPQLENLIRKLAEIKIGDTTNLQDEKQEEFTFGTVLHKLKEYTDKTLCRELELFFTDRSGIGLRNSMMHGLASTFEVQQYSVYVLYLALKLFVHEDKFLYYRSNEKNRQA